MSYQTVDFNAIVSAPVTQVTGTLGPTEVADAGIAIYNDAGKLGWVGTSGFRANINTSGNTADRSYTFPDENATLVSTTVTSLPNLSTVGTSITAGAWTGSIISPTYGGTGVNNGANTITVGGAVSIGGAFTTSANALTLTTTGATNVTLPTSGTLINSDETTLSSLSSVGTITTGVWNASTIEVSYGGTGATTLAAGGVLYGNGTSAVAASVGTAGQLLVSAGAGAPTWSGTITYASNKLTGLATPTANSDAVNKLYVDTAIAGLSWKSAARAATTANLVATYDNGVSGVGATLTNADTQAALVLDGTTLVNGDRVLVKDQTLQIHNGIYVVTDIGSISTNWVLTRAPDADNQPGEELNSAAIYVTEGTAHASTSWVQVTPDVVIETSNVVWSQFAGTNTYTAGNGLTLTGNQFSLTTPVSAANGGTGFDGSSAPNGSLAIGNGAGFTNATLTGTTDQVIVTNGAGSITLSTPQNIATSSTPTFSSMTLSSASSQLTLGTGAGALTISSPAKAAASTYTVPDVGTSSDFVMTAGAQTITGDKTFSGTVNLSALTASKPLLLDGTNNVISGDVSLTSQVTGVLPIANGGTNSSTALSNDRIMVSSAGAIVEAAALTDGQLLIGSTGAAPVAATLTAGTGVTIVNAAGSITISSTAAALPQVVSFLTNQVTVSGTSLATVAYLPYDHSRFSSLTVKTITAYVVPGDNTRDLTIEVFDGTVRATQTVAAGGAAQVVVFTASTWPAADALLQLRVVRSAGTGTNPIVQGVTIEYSSA
jgi:hypothetical protein